MAIPDPPPDVANRNGHAHTRPGQRPGDSGKKWLTAILGRQSHVDASAFTKQCGDARGQARTKCQRRVS